MPITRLSQLSKYYHTIKHCKWVQIYGRILLKFKTKKCHLALPPARRSLTCAIHPFIIKDDQKHAPLQFNFLNHTIDVTPKEIWNDGRLDRLWLYNLHYFDVLNTSSVCVWQPQWIARWIAENPPAQGGIGWDPYPTSLRIVNWIKWVLSGNQPSDELLHSLAIQVRFLSKRLEIHLLGNHLLANAKALLFAGLFFSGAEGEKWLRVGQALFCKELSEQILKDGGHFELSPMYHSIILEDLLDIINVLHAYGQSIPADYLTVCNSMFDWLQQMCHPDGHIAFFNDATLGVAPTLQMLELYRARLGLSGSYPIKKALTYLPHTGYCRIECDHFLLLADVAAIGAVYQPGHGHADTLSFELSLRKQRFIVNSGISCYADSEKRLMERGGASHNTLMINNLNSSMIWKNFRVARRAHVFNTETTQSDRICSLKASHDGYYATYKIYHTRHWKIENGELLVEDEVNGKGWHQLSLFFHFHPDVILRQQTDYEIGAHFMDTHGAALLKFQVPATIVDTTYHPGFNISLPNKKIVVELYEQLPFRLITSIKALESNSP